MKLLDIIKELEKPKQVYTGGEEETASDDFLKKGFKLSKQTVNPETGTVSSEVEYLPEFERIRREIMQMRREFQPFKFSSNPDIAKLSKDINTNMTKLSQMIFALDKMLELQRKG